MTEPGYVNGNRPTSTVAVIATGTGECLHSFNGAASAYCANTVPRSIPMPQANATS